MVPGDDDQGPPTACPDCGGDVVDTGRDRFARWRCADCDSLVLKADSRGRDGSGQEG